MIKSIRHKGLRRLFEDGNAKGVRADHLQRIEDILSVLAVAESVQELSLPSYRLHPLKGKLRGFWSVAVSANWRIIFRFEGGDCHEVDLVDYH
jgi:proteic killer suppression protein